MSYHTSHKFEVHIPLSWQRMAKSLGLSLGSYVWISINHDPLLPWFLGDLFVFGGVIFVLICFCFVLVKNYLKSSHFLFECESLLSFKVLSLGFWSHFLFSSGLLTLCLPPPFLWCFKMCIFRRILKVYTIKSRAPTCLKIYLASYLADLAGIWID